MTNKKNTSSNSQTFFWLYTVLGIISIFLSLLLINGLLITEFSYYFGNVFCSVFLIILCVFAGYYGYNYWNYYKHVFIEKIPDCEFYNTIIFMFLFRNLGEFIGKIIGIMFFLIIAISSLLVENVESYLELRNLSFIDTSLLSIFLYPLIGFSVVIITRVIFEQLIRIFNFEIKNSNNEVFYIKDIFIEIFKKNNTAKILNPFNLKSSSKSTEKLLIAINYLPNIFIIITNIFIILFLSTLMILNPSLEHFIPILFTVIPIIIIYKLAKVALNDFKAEIKYFFNNSNSSVTIEVFPKYYYKGTLDKYIRIRAVAILVFFIFLPSILIILNQIDLNGIDSTALFIISTLIFILLTRLNAFYLSKNRSRSILKTFLIILLSPIPIGYIIILLTPKYPKVIKKQNNGSKIIGIILFIIGILGLILRLYFIINGKNNNPEIIASYIDRTDSFLTSFYNLLHILYCVGLIVLGSLFIEEGKLKNKTEKGEITPE